MELILLKPLFEGKREMDVNLCLQQLTYKKFKSMCWGITKRANIENKGLLIKVNGMKFKEWILITLNGLDWYEIDFVKSNGTVVKHLGDVFCEDMCDLVDDYIERLDTYIR